MNNIRKYLCRVASEITRRDYDGVKSPADWPVFQERIRRDYLDMLSLPQWPPEGQRPPLNVRITGVLKRDGFRIEKVLFEALPRLYVTANLYVPEGGGRKPAVVYACGHSTIQKAHYQHHARRWCELGFVCLIYDTVQYGEIRGYHHGTYRWGWFNWFSRGYAPAAIECFNGMRAIDLLQERPEVDPERIGVTGISGGGGATWWIACADPRVKAAAAVCGTGTVEAHLRDKTFDGHCDCMFYPNIYGWDLHHIGALIAPRPLMIASMDKDGLYEIGSVGYVYERLARVYKEMGAADNLQLVVTPGGHGYHIISRQRIFSFFIKHLMGKEVPPEQIADTGPADGPETLEDQLVLKDGPPADERTTTVQEWFVPKAAPPAINTAEQLAAVRQAMREKLLATTFRHFPTAKLPLNIQTLYVNQSEGCLQRYMQFDSENDWRLWLMVNVPSGLAGRSAAWVTIRSPGEGRAGYEGFAAEARLGGQRWGRLFAVLEPRGTGDTAWGDTLNWHLRRHAWLTGRTLASMRVWDVLRGLAAVRAQPEVEPGQITLVASGETAPVAIMAALLDGNLRSVVLEQAPATFDAPSQPDGRGPAIEMLNVLKVLDLPVAAGLLWPAEIVFVGGRPQAYQWAEDLYARLGKPGRIVRSKDAIRI